MLIYSSTVLPFHLLFCLCQFLFISSYMLSFLLRATTTDDSHYRLILQIVFSNNSQENYIRIPVRVSQSPRRQFGCLCPANILKPKNIVFAIKFDKEKQETPTAKKLLFSLKGALCYSELASVTFLLVICEWIVTWCEKLHLLHPSRLSTQACGQYVFLFNAAGS